MEDDDTLIDIEPPVTLCACKLPLTEAEEQAVRDLRESEDFWKVVATAAGIGLGAAATLCGYMLGTL